MTRHTHTLIIKVDRHPLDHEPPDVDFTVKCHGVTDACAEWTECKQADCPGNTGGDDTLYDVSPIAHGQEHRYFDETTATGYWAVRTGGCWAENNGHAAAEEFAEEQGLADGTYDVDVEVDDSTVIITRAAAVAA